MRHKFQRNRCVFCGINLAVSGYSEECPAREEERSDWRSDPYNQDPSNFHPHLRTQNEAAGGGRCYRCNANVIPKIVRETNTAGVVGIPIAGHTVYRAFDQTRHHLECPNCGAPFEDDATIRELNGDLSPETKSTLFICGLFGAFVLLFVMVIAWASM